MGMQDPIEKLDTQRDALTVLTKASLNLTHAQHAAETATTARDDAIRDAISAGITYKVIAEITGLTEGRIGQIRNHTR